MGVEHWIETQTELGEEITKKAHIAKCQSKHTQQKMFQVDNLNIFAH